ncbi:MalY/PatB family protein [Alkalicoccus urumqiensis]|uniref:cysteine-S-conjugate beta-lyase n=1 Tax=Alkalicoccus urumqiensis TaxID=1548213 RepID=A0A2P6MIA5_ALKUR|nr:PatB family C-S lyase [Alkalicoccus urumqiensis]PRO65983.1 cystathionine beta-lyase [Alkalicoccus urumqiensis]
MNFFQEYINRKNTYSVKWDKVAELYKSEKELLPMWVADMDFHPPEAVTKTIRERAEHGLYGYTYVDDRVKEAVRDWFSSRQNWTMELDWIQFSPGVVPSIAKSIQALTEPDDGILLQSPVYPPFFSMIKENDRRVVDSPLVEKNGRYEIDFQDLEEKMSQGVRMFLLCSPHNPVGRVWTKEELEKIASLCIRWDVILVTDEIHGDLVFEPNVQIPAASISPQISQQTITLAAPSKTFNLAGLQSSVLITENEEYRKKLEQIDKKNGAFTLNTFGILAMQAAYEEGEAWLEELLEYLQGNIRLVDSFLQAELPHVKAVQPEATYLVWIDCRGTGLSNAELSKALVEEGRIALNPGHTFGEAGDGFMRMNVACPRDTVKEGLNRLKKALKDKKGS